MGSPGPLSGLFRALNFNAVESPPGPPRLGIERAPLVSCLGCCARIRSRSNGIAVHLFSTRKKAAAERAQTRVVPPKQSNGPNKILCKNPSRRTTGPLHHLRDLRDQFCVDFGVTSEAMMYRTELELIIEPNVDLRFSKYCTGYRRRTGKHSSLNSKADGVRKKLEYLAQGVKNAEFASGRKVEHQLLSETHSKVRVSAAL